MSSDILTKLMVRQQPVARSTTQPNRLPIADMRETKQLNSFIENMKAVRAVESVVVKPAISFEPPKTIEERPAVKPKRLVIRTGKEPVVVVPPKEPRPAEEPVVVVLPKEPRPAEEQPVKKVPPAKPKLVIRNGIPAGKLTGDVDTYNDIKIGDANIRSRFGSKKPSVLVKSSTYYNYNREVFINFINALFSKYKEELKRDATTASCDSRSGDDVDLMSHQKIVRDYINLYTPYRGILLYHGLGSGKTCASIAIAEGMKDTRKILVLTPAALRKNYLEELKKCGDSMYKKNQFWEFVESTPETIKAMSAVLNIETDYIQTSGGAWLVNITKKPNYDSLDARNKTSLDKQLDHMIKHKYRFISYNGLRKSALRELTTESGTKQNPFDNAVVIIDEAHNMVSRIVNKLSRKTTDNVSIELYELLMTANNARIVLLSGTPIINYPNEIAVLFNILRGYIKTWILKLTISSSERITKQFFEDIFKSTTTGGNVADFIEYNSSTSTLTITRNPFGFVNQKRKEKYDGIRDSVDILTDEGFITNITRLLKTARVTISDTRVEMYKALPDKLDEFKNKFINSDNSVKNMNLLKRRILGLTSYFRSAQENLMPKFTPDNFHIAYNDMSDIQFSIYEAQRVIERKQEMSSKKPQKRTGAGVFEETVSTYRIFSRAFCNFVFPDPDKHKRPMPSKSLTALSDDADIDEDAIEPGSKKEDIDGLYDADEIAETRLDNAYDDRVKAALTYLNDNKQDILVGSSLKICSPKFKNMLENIMDIAHSGLHLVYSQFRTLEGIGIFKLVLEANGFTEFVINNSGGEWRLAVPMSERKKPMFVLYTGTETVEQKEIFRNVFNGDWKYIPSALRTDIETISRNNLNGEVIKVFMITASGAEGISLKNTRFIHLMEPYWHPVRIQQVIGRARRICSHQDLPEHLRTVDVFLYLMKFSEKQIAEASIELKTKDSSKLNTGLIFTTDQSLWEIANIKESITENLLLAVKESSIDCSIHSNVGSEKLTCFSFGNVTDTSKFSYSGAFENEQSDLVAKQNKQTVLINPVEIEYRGVKYAYDDATDYIYDYDSYLSGQVVHIGRLDKTAGELKIILLSESF